jgi:hypothetical protein
MGLILDINMVKGKGEWEVDTDGVMGLLRTVCVKRTPPSIHQIDFLLFVFVK